MTSRTIAVIGAGLAGSEAALVCAQNGITVKLYEMRPEKMTPAHRTGLPAELICSNSLKSCELPTAHALLKSELSLLGSPLLSAAFDTRIPAGSALAVDRERFSQQVLRRIESEPLITLVREECDAPPTDCDVCIIAAGPLVSEKLAAWLVSLAPASALHFYDAIAPSVTYESVDQNVAFFAARWGKGNADYINCPFTEDEYRKFYEALLSADKAVARSFESEKFFEACLPIEVVAQRDYKALTFGTMRPIGFDDPRTGRRPYAVCQLRRENTEGTAWGLVGFQTRLTIPEQRNVFRLIPGLSHAEFLRFGAIHRNTYLDSPTVLTPLLAFKNNSKLFLAGQLSGSEGYTEAIATGHCAARFAMCQLAAKDIVPPPPTTALGGLLRHVTMSEVRPFAPNNCNYGIIDSLAPQKKRISSAEKKSQLCERALKDIGAWKSLFD
jgi:methylenetetrahydrofolate--tRNA-(uracil-5-)-methyltransferase